MRELIIRQWCDRCESLGQPRTEAQHTYTIGIVSGEARPALRVIELCDECDAAELPTIIKMVADHSIPLDTKTALAKPPPVAPAALQPGERIECLVCGRSLVKSAIIGHVWSQHRKGQTKPPPPSVCPTCRKVFDPQGMTMHRVLNHDFSPIDEAYKGVL